MRPALAVESGDYPGGRHECVVERPFPVGRDIEVHCAYACLSLYLTPLCLEV
jgi:hypothetical protein